MENKRNLNSIIDMKHPNYAKINLANEKLYLGRLHDMCTPNLTFSTIKLFLPEDMPPDSTSCSIQYRVPAPDCSLTETEDGLSPDDFFHYTLLLAFAFDFKTVNDLYQDNLSLRFAPACASPKPLHCPPYSILSLDIIDRSKFTQKSIDIGLIYATCSMGGTDSEDKSQIMPFPYYCYAQNVRFPLTSRTFMPKGDRQDGKKWQRNIFHVHGDCILLTANGLNYVTNCLKTGLISGNDWKNVKIPEDVFSSMNSESKADNIGRSHNP